MQERPYREHVPPPALASYVDRFWTRTTEQTRAPHRVMPDGCVDLVVDLRDGSADVVGTMTVAATIPSAAADLVAVRFRPGTAARFARVPLESIADANVAAADLGIEARALVDALSATGDEDDRVARLAAFVRARLADADPVDRLVRAAVARLTRTARPSVAGIAAELGVTRQHLARLFAREVGIGPKELARVARLQRAILAFERGRRDLGALAHELGFADHAHFVHELQDLAGTTPSELAAERGSISPIASVYGAVDPGRSFATEHSP